MVTQSQQEERQGNCQTSAETIVEVNLCFLKKFWNNVPKIKKSAFSEKKGEREKETSIRGSSKRRWLWFKSYRENWDPFAGGSVYLFFPTLHFVSQSDFFVVIKGAALTAQRKKIQSLFLQWQNKSSTDGNILCTGLPLCPKTIQKWSLLGQEVMQLCYTVQHSRQCQLYTCQLGTSCGSAALLLRQQPRALAAKLCLLVAPKLDESALV